MVLSPLSLLPVPLSFFFCNLCLCIRSNPAVEASSQESVLFCSVQIADCRTLQHIDVQTAFQGKCDNRSHLFVHVTCVHTTLSMCCGSSLLFKKRLTGEHVKLSPPPPSPSRPHPHPPHLMPLHPLLAHTRLCGSLIFSVVCSAVSSVPSVPSSPGLASWSRLSNAGSVVIRMGTGTPPRATGPMRHRVSYGPVGFGAVLVLFSPPPPHSPALGTSLVTTHPVSSPPSRHAPTPSSLPHPEWYAPAP